MSPKRVFVAIGAGSNLGDREGTLRRGVAEVSDLLSDPRRGGLYESSPLGDTRQPDYLNTVVAGYTHIAPEPLLAILKFLELRAGRGPGPRWSSRPLDLDLLLYGDELRRGPELTLPHPGLRRRAFVLAPLADAAPGLELPPDGATVESLLAATEGLETLRPVRWSDTAHSAEEE